MESLNERIYSILTEMVIGEGGDGDAAIVSEYYKEYADEFEIWANKVHPGRFTRVDHADKVVIFSLDEEAIFFSREDNFPTWVGNKLINPCMNRPVR